MIEPNCLREGLQRESFYEACGVKDCSGKPDPSVLSGLYFAIDKKARGTPKKK